MRAGFFTGLGRVEVRAGEPPRLERPEDVLVRVDRVGVCGSDVHYFTHGRIGDQTLAYPATVGHECAGTLLEVGAEVARLRPGDRVAIDPAIACGSCDQCRKGRWHTCRSLQFLGCPGEAPGAAADYHVLPAANCFAVPESMSLDTAALVEPLSVGLHSVRLARPGAGAKVAVLGSGPIGLSVLLCLRATVEATSSYVTDLRSNRLEAAARCGADWTGNPQSDAVVEAILQREPAGLDVVFECSGEADCIGQAMRLLTPGGTLVLVGIPVAGEVRYDSSLARRKELVFQNVRRQNECVGPVIELIASGQIDPAPLLTHRFPLEAIQEAFDLVAGYSDGVIKAVLDLSAA